MNPEIFGVKAMKRVLRSRDADPEYTPVSNGSEFPLSRRGIAAIHGATMEVLANTGFRFVSENEPLLRV